MRLLGVEWLRLRSRRAFWALVLLAFVGVALSLASLARDAQPPTAAEITAAEELAAQEAQQPYIQDELERCEEARAEGDETMFGPDFDCADLVPQPEWYYFQRTVDFVADAGALMVPTASMFGLAALLVGATFTGADWSAGTIGTQLLFESRRRRVFAAKTVAVAVATGVAAAIATALAPVVVYLIASAWGSTSGTEAAVDDLVLAGLRGLVAVAAAGAVGAALALAFRRSIAVLGLVFAYLFLGEGLLQSLWDGAAPWLVSSRLNAWLQGGFEVYDYQACTGFGECEPVITHLSTAAGGVYLVVGVALLVGMSAVVFERRDVG